MDYTKIPRQLIYKDRRSLKDFGVYDKNQYNEMIALALHELYIKNENYKAEECAVLCMNNAYYICTMALLEDNPVWRLKDYHRITLECVHNHINLAHASLALVYILLSPYGKIGSYIEVMLEEMRTSPDLCKRVRDIITFLPNDKPSQEVFNPRIIDSKTIHDVEKTGFSWRELTDYYEEDLVLDLIETLGKNDSEKLELIKMFENDIVRFYSIDSPASKEKLSTMKEIREKINNKPLKKDTNQLNEQEQDGVVDSEASLLLEKIVELEKKNQSLNKENDNLNLENRKLNRENRTLDTENHNLNLENRKLNEENRNLLSNNKDLKQEMGSQGQNQDLESLKNQLAEAQKTIDDQAQTIIELRAEKQTHENWYDGEFEKLPDNIEFTLRERVVFFITVLSLELDKKYTVFANLAKLIDDFCNDQNHIAPFISRMKKPEEAAANAKAAKKVADLLKCIIPKEYQQDKHIKINQIIESMIMNFPDSEEE